MTVVRIELPPPGQARWPPGFHASAQGKRKLSQTPKYTILSSPCDTQPPDTQAPAFLGCLTAALPAGPAACSARPQGAQIPVWKLRFSLQPVKDVEKQRKNPSAHLPPPAVPRDMAIEGKESGFLGSHLAPTALLPLGTSPALSLCVLATALQCL